MDAGLANQTFQYIFVRYLEETTKERVLIDDSYFLRMQAIVNQNKENQQTCNLSGTHNGYELDYVFPYATKPLLMSQQFESNVWHKMVEASNGHVSEVMESNMALHLFNTGMDSLTAVYEISSEKAFVGYPGRKFLTPRYEFNPDVAKVSGDTYYSGYWVISGWLEAHKEAILKDLVFRPITDAKNLQYESDIRDNFSVGVHIRRGDYVNAGWATPESHYMELFDELKNEVPSDAVYFIFSDQLDWCMENAKELGLPKNTVFVEGNFDYKNNYVDMYLMTLCSVLVVGASSFSYLASLLNKREGFKAVQTKDAKGEAFKRK